MATKKAIRSYTTTSGERVTKYSDGSEKRVPASTSTKTVSYGTSSSGKKLESTGDKLRTSEGQTLKDYSIAWGSGNKGSTGITSDSSGARNSENNLRQDIDDNLSRLQRDLERQIERERKALEARRKAEVGNINEDFDKSRADTEFAQKREVGGTATALARAGGYLGVTASQEGVLQNLANTHRAEIDTLENSRQDALRAANNAYEDRDFELAREKLAIARETEQEIYNRQQEFDKINREKLQELQDQQTKAATQAAIFGAIDSGADDVQSIFEALGGTTTVEDITKVLSAIKPKSDDGFTFSASNMASLLGAGFSKDDIQVMNDYINENGYTDEFRATLESPQRVALDKIFRAIEKTTGSSGTDINKPLSILDIQRLEDTYGVLFPLGVTGAEATQFIQDNIGASPAEMQAAIDAIFGNVSEQGISDNFRIEVSEEWFRNNLNTTQLKKLADLVGASTWWRYKTYDINAMFDTPEFFTLLGQKIQALRDQGISDTEILAALTT